MTVTKTSLNPYALITGGSSGLGRSIAFQLAQIGYNIILVALDDALLYEAEAKIKNETGVDVKSIGCNLAEPESIETIVARVIDFKINLCVLVNNVGIGNTSFFHSNSIDFNRKIVRLNCLVMIEATNLLLPELRKNESAYILNISSLAGLFPVPYKAVYSASKHFVKAFSLSLGEELAEENIFVTAVYPGPIQTNPGVIQRTKSFGRLAKLCSYTSDEIAHLSLKSLFAKRKSLTPGFMNKLYQYVRYLIGYKMTMKLVKKGMRREAIKDLRKKEETFLIKI